MGAGPYLATGLALVGAVMVAAAAYRGGYLVYDLGANVARVG